MKKQLIEIVVISLLFIGCGGNSTGSNTTTTSEDSVQVASTTENTNVPTYKVINSRGIAVEGKLDNYTVKLYSDNEEEVKPQGRHKGVVVKYNGKTSESMAIQESYQGKNIVAGIYNGDKLIKMSDSIKVTDDVPVVIMDIK